MENTHTIYLKINRKKLTSEKIFFDQLEKISNYLMEKRKLNVSDYSIRFGMIENDFFTKKVTVELKYNLHGSNN